VTDTRSEFNDLLWVFLPITAAVFVIIALLVLGIVVRSRRRERDPGWRSAWPVAEAAYAAVLLVFVVVLVVFTFRAESRVDAVSDDPGLELEVVAFQWQWAFTYPNGVTVVGSRSELPDLVVPADTEVHFRLTSRDVVHSFWIPELRFKRDAFPNHVNEFTLVFPDEGEFVGRCAEFCGLRHSNMDFDVVVLDRPAFDAWLAERG
jgi:cytochrome c oxidase subunit 2